MRSTQHCCGSLVLPALRQACALPILGACHVGLPKFRPSPHRGRSVSFKPPTFITLLLNQTPTHCQSLCPVYYIRHCERRRLAAALWFFDDIQHSEKEQRTLALGKTFDKRLLSIVFTIRRNKIRVISARDMSKKERKIYEENSKEDTSI